jgi:hypothetical protein
MAIDLSAKAVNVIVQPYSPLAEKFPPDLKTSLVAPLEAYINEMLTGLHINAICSVAVEPDPARRDSLQPIRVYIGGSRCIQPITIYPTSPTDYLDSLPHQIEEIICKNRNLFVSDRLARDYRRAWGADNEIDDFLFGFLRQLVYRGFSLNRAKSWLDSGGNVNADLDAAVDEATQGEPPSVRIYLPENLRQDRNALLPHLMRCIPELGIGSVGMILQFETMPQDWAFRVKFNDVALPAIRKRELAQTKSNYKGHDNLLGAIRTVLERHLSQLISTASVAAQIGAVSKRYPSLEQDVRQRFSTQTLTEILRGLAEEGMPIYDAKTIFESLVMANGRTTAGKRMSRIVLLPDTASFSQLVEPSKTKDLSNRELNQIVRTALRRHIGAKYTHDKQLAVITVHPDLERYFIDNEDRRLDAHQMRQLFKDLNQELIAWRKQNPRVTAPVVLLTTMEVRSQIYAAFRDTFPELPVLGYSELPDDISIEQVGRLELADLPEDFTDVRDMLKVKDEEIDEEIQNDVPDQGEQNRLLLGLAAYAGYLKKLKVRSDELPKADNEVREFLTQEIELLEAEISTQHFTEDRPDDLSDVISDFFKF